MTTPSRRKGYTLLEVLLVAAVMVVFAALAVPSLKSMHGSYKMTGSVDAVRSAWAQARARAIEEGRPYRFAVEQDGSYYRVAPDRPDYWSGSGPGEDPQGKGFVLEQSLPGGVRFNVNGDLASAAPPDDPSPKDEKPAPSADSYTVAAVFLPDGTAREDVKILFQVRGATPTMVHLRGLTGSVSVTPMKR